MKRATSSLLTAIVLVLFQPIFVAAGSDSVANWRPIAEITGFEKEIIQQATRQSPDWIYRDTKAFRVKHEVVVEILLKDGSIRYYAAGEYKSQNSLHHLQPDARELLESPPNIIRSPEKRSE